MKKLLLSIAALTLFSFGTTSKSDPKSVAQNFLNALTKMDYEEAKKYSTPETAKMLDMLASFSEMMPDSVKSKSKDLKVEIKGVKENGDKCDVTYNYSNGEKDEDRVLKLEKKDGKWLVVMTKDDSMDADDDTGSY